MSIDNAKRYIVVKAKEMAPEQRFQAVAHIDEHRPIARELAVMDAVPLLPEEVETVRSLPHVISVWEDRAVTFPEPKAQEDGGAEGIGALRFHKVPEVWQQGLRGKGVKLAVLDTGLDRTHSETTFTARLGPAKNFTSSADWYDRQGHGTHCAGIAAAPEALQCGVAPEATLLVGKVLGDEGWGTWSGIIAGLEWAVQQGARVISMSIGGGGSPDDPLSLAVDAATAKGVIVVAAAGNEGCATYTADMSSPGCARGATSVAAVDVSGNIASFSSCGTVVDIAAAGVGITSLGPSGSNGKVMSGTSMATPHVAGAAALLLSAGFSAAIVRKALYAGARNTALEPHREGYGVMDALASLAYLKGLYYPDVPRVRIGALSYDSNRGKLRVGTYYGKDAGLWTPKGI